MEVPKGEEAKGSRVYPSYIYIYVPLKVRIRRENRNATSRTEIKDNTTHSALWFMVPSVSRNSPHRFGRSDGETPQEAVNFENVVVLGSYEAIADDRHRTGSDSHIKRY